MEVMPNHMVKKGEIVFSEGDEPDALYYICYGKVQISRSTPGGESELATLGEGDVFGEMAIINNATRNATITATEDTGFLKMSPETLQKYVDDLPPAMRGVFRVLVVTIRSMLNERGELDGTLAKLSEELEKSKKASEAAAAKEAGPSVGRMLAF